MASKPELSVVVIGRNEAANICRCLDAILRATKGLQAEIVYVDSGSTDGTVEAASKYDINILTLREGWVLSPAAGRYIGTIHTRGKYILFCDGDVQVCKKWLIEALVHIKEHQYVGGVGGTLIHHFPNDTGQAEVSMQEPQPIKDAGLTPRKSLVGGVCMYRREALEQAGHFNPYLYAEEEWELAQRIRAERFHLVELSICAGHHFTVKRLTLKGVLKRKNTWDCYGQLIRLGARRKGFWWGFLTGPMRYILAYNGVTAILAAIAIVSGFIGANIWWVISPLITILIIAVFFTLRRKAIVAFPLFIFRSIYILWRTLIVFLTYKPMNASNYPTHAEIVKRAKG